MNFSQLTNAKEHISGGLRQLEAAGGEFLSSINKILELRVGVTIG